LNVSGYLKASYNSLSGPCQKFFLKQFVGRATWFG